MTRGARYVVFAWLATAAACHCVGVVSGGGDGGGFTDGAVSSDGGAGTDSGGLPFPDAGTCTYTVAADAGALGPGWTPTGPPGGYVASVLALGDGGVLAGTGYTKGFEQPFGQGGALYRSSDMGMSFTQVQPFASTTVSSLVGIRGTPRIYAAVGSLSGSPDDGVWVSNDEGVTFTQDNVGFFTGARVRTLSVGAGPAELVYAMVEGNSANPLNAIASLFLRVDGGTWNATAMTGVNPTSGGPALAMAADVADPNRVYLADGANFYVSTDQGNTFTPVSFSTAATPSFALAEVNALFADPADAGHLFFSTLNTGVYESTDRGATFHITGINFGAASAVAVGGGRTLIGTELSGLAVASASAGPFSEAVACPPLPAVRAISIAPDDPNAIFVGTVGAGVLHSSDGAATFSPQQSGIYEMVARVAVTAGPTAWILSPAGLFHSSDLGATWVRVSSVGQALPFADIAQDPSNPDRLVVATDDDAYEGGGTGPGVLILSKSTGSATVGTGLASTDVAAVLFDPTSASRVFAYERQCATCSNVATGVYASTNAGTSFDQTAMQGTTYDLTSFFRGQPMAVENDGTLYAGVIDATTGLATLWRSTTQGQTYSAIFNTTNTDADGGPAAPWLPMGVYLDGSGDVYLAGRQNDVALYESVDGGAFVGTDGGLPGVGELLNGLALTPDGGIVVASWGGAFYAPDGVNFADFNTGFPAAPPVVWNVVVLPGSPPTVLAATSLGVFRRQLGP